MTDRFINVQCNRCGATTRVLRGTRTFYCDYCGGQQVLDDGRNEYFRRTYNDADVIDAQRRAERSRAMSGAERFAYVLTHVVWAVLLVMSAVACTVFFITDDLRAIAICVWSSIMFAVVTYYLLTRRRED